MENKTFCPCPKTTCPLHGNCKACIAKHKKAGQIPHCLFEDNNGDRSLKNFFLTLKKQFEPNEYNL